MTTRSLRRKYFIASCAKFCRAAAIDVLHPVDSRVEFSRTLNHCYADASHYRLLGHIEFWRVRLSYNLTLRCGCVVHVSVRPASRIAQTRIIRTRGRQCAAERHQIGLRLRLWELLP